jgi:hypothetical protein
MRRYLQVASVVQRTYTSDSIQDPVTSTDLTTDTQSGTARTTPGLNLTIDELQRLLAPGDEITTKSGVKIKMVKGNDGSLLFKKELPVMTPGNVSWLCSFIHHTEH